MTSFACYINRNWEYYIKGEQIPALLYVDGIVLMANSEPHVQKMLAIIVLAKPHVDAA